MRPCQNLIYQVYYIFYLAIHYCCCYYNCWKAFQETHSCAEQVLYYFLGVLYVEVLQRCLTMNDGIVSGCYEGGYLKEVDVVNV